MRKAFLLVCVATFAVSFYFLHFYFIQSPKTYEGYKFETIEGKRICANNSIYVLGFKNGEAVITANGWNLTLRGLRASNVLKCFNSGIYAAGIDVVKIRNGKIEWVKDLAIKRISYEGTRENPIPVYYEDLLNVFEDMLT